MVHGRDYEKANIVRYVNTHGNRDPLGKLVDISRDIIPSTIVVQRMCKKALKKQREARTHDVQNNNPLSALQNQPRALSNQQPQGIWEDLSDSASFVLSDI